MGGKKVIKIPSSHPGSVRHCLADLFLIEIEKTIESERTKIMEKLVKR